MPPLTNDEIARRLETPWEAHRRELEALKASRPSYGGWSSREEQLAAEKRAADQERREREAVEARKKRDDERRAERERKAHERGVAELDEYRARALAAWLSAGGTESGFRDNWPKMRDDRLRELAQAELTREERLVEELVARGRAEGGFGRL